MKTPVKAPKANGFCERLVGTLRRECLDYLIPINDRHLKLILKEFVVHYNRGRPHSALGPGIPEPIQDSVPAQRPSTQASHRAPRCFETRFSVACTTNIAWKRRTLDEGLIICGQQGVATSFGRNSLAFFEADEINVETKTLQMLSS